jgi:hypothetical protein
VNPLPYPKSCGHRSSCGVHASVRGTTHRPTGVTLHEPALVHSRRSGRREMTRSTPWRQPHSRSQRAWPRRNTRRMRRATLCSSRPRRARNPIHSPFGEIVFAGSKARSSRVEASKQVMPTSSPAMAARTRAADSGEQHMPPANDARPCRGARPRQPNNPRRRPAGPGLASRRADDGGRRARAAALPPPAGSRLPTPRGRSTPAASCPLR